MKPLTLLVPLLAIGCRAPASEPLAPTAVSWVLVSRPCAEFDGMDRADIARVASSTPMLVLEPVIDRGAVLLDAICRHRMSVQRAPAERFQVGQVAAVEVSIDIYTPEKGKTKYVGGFWQKTGKKGQEYLMGRIALKELGTVVIGSVAVDFSKHDVPIDAKICRAANGEGNGPHYHVFRVAAAVKAEAGAEEE